ncbi:MAG: autotransporter domain-containing protein, partial [Rhodospirillales bacterium]|nr:autotransporter domain-containing protein [Rhodospirillales bacterium]
TLPDLGGTPGYSQDSAAKLAAGTATIYHNQRLGNELAAIKAANPTINIVTVPVVTLEAAILANPGAFGITNTSAACLDKTTGTVCASTRAGQNSYFFWDDVHPTTGTHALIAQAARIMTTGAEAATRSADSQGDAGMLLSRAMDRDVGDRLRRLHDGAVGSRISMAALTLGGIGPQLAAAGGYPGATLAEAPADIERPFAMFASGGWQTARLDAASDRTGLSQDGATIAIGGDWRPLPDLALGLAAGYGSGDVSLKGNGGSFDLAAWRLTAYAAYTRPSWYVDGTLGHAWLGFDDIRRNTGFGGMATSGETDGRAVTASLGSGYRLSRGNATFGPVAGLRWTRLSVGAYSETGGFGLGQRWDRQTADALSGELGVEAILHHRFRGTVVEPRLRLAWEPMIEDGRRNVRARLLDNTADAVSAGARGLGDAVSVEAGLDARLAGGASLGIAYQGSWELQAGGASHRVAAHLAVKF